eukprot:gb/GFBE01036405.1/.p1 GENE.gb/GFBE01036405.1/~~gb/GFBE01036405.1/.p1  ORF type:complete len:268 (+),score=35.47 gb/GFBE01036405.1/:1-804(+)
MASVDASFCSSADLVFQTRSLRPFLNHPGVHQTGNGFYKPVNPEHRPSSKAGGGVLLGPFQTKSSKEERRGQQQQQQLAQQPRLRLKSPRSSPSLRSGAGGAASGKPDICIGPVESSASRRRRPVHDSRLDGDPEKIPFSEEPDDARVAVPAHRIGDEPPVSRLSRTCLSGLTTGRRGAPARPGPKRLAPSSSAPSLLLSVKQLPVSAGGSYGGSGSPGFGRKGAGMSSLVFQDNLGMTPTTSEQAALARLFMDSPSSVGCSELLEP